MDTHGAGNPRLTGPRTVFGPDHEAFRESVRRFFETEIVPHHRQWERDGIVPRALWRKAGATMVRHHGGGRGGAVPPDQH